MDRSYLLVNLMGVFTRCPLGDRIHTCPVFSLSRTLTPKQFYEYIRAFSDTELLELYKKHKNCVNCRNNIQIIRTKKYSG